MASIFLSDTEILKYSSLGREYKNTLTVVNILDSVLNNLIVPTLITPWLNVQVFANVLSSCEPDVRIILADERDSAEGGDERERSEGVGRKQGSFSDQQQHKTTPPRLCAVVLPRILSDC